MLSEKKKEYFRKSLTRRLDEIRARAQSTLTDISDLRGTLSDEMDQASFDCDIGFALRIRDREAKLMRKIREALERLEEGTFGICEECGQEISLKRLMARPVTTLCIDCKKEQEAGEKANAINL